MSKDERGQILPFPSEKKDSAVTCALKEMLDIADDIEMITIIATRRNGRHEFSGGGDVYLALHCLLLEDVVNMLKRKVLEDTQ